MRRCPVSALPLGPGAPLVVSLGQVAGAALPRPRRHPILTLGVATTAAGSARAARAEAVERISGFFHGDETRIRESFRRLRSDAVDPTRYLLYSDRQYASRHRRRQPRWIPRPFDADQPIDWSPIHSLTTGRTRFLPTSLIYYARREAFGRADSNGVAAAADPHDARLRALLELVERDSVALWWYNRARRPAVALDATAPLVGRVRQWIERRGREVWALDLTSDLGIPVVAALSTRPTSVGRREIALGFGAGLTRWEAARRALFEMTGILSLMRAAAHGRLVLPAETRRWFREGDADREPWLRPGPGRPRPLRRTRPNSTPGPEQTVRRLTRRLARHGLEVLVSDLTRPGYGLHVARVVVPGLRHWWPRFAPGRLYDAPVAAGWQAAALPESRLNPRPFML